MSTPFRSKLMFSALGLFLPGTGFNCFYLLGIKSFWGWIQLTSLIAGILGFLLLSISPESSAAAWVLIVLGFIALVIFKRLVHKDATLCSVAIPPWGAGRV